MNEKPSTDQIDWSKGFPVTAGHMRLGLTEASPESAEYWEGVKRGELILKRCRKCGRHLHPRRMGCPDCYNAGLDLAQASGQATVYSFSTVHRATSPEFAASVPYCVGIVELAEGVHLFSRIFTADGAEPSVGDPVELEFRTLENGQYLPVFVHRGAAT